MSSVFRPKLRARLALLLALAIFPAAGLILHNGVRERRAATEAVRQETLRLARRAAARHEQLVEGARQLCVALAHASEVKGDDARACAGLLASFKTDLALYSNVVVALRNGEVFASAVPLNRPLNMADRSWFRDAIRTRSFTAGEYQLGRSSAKPMIPFAQPVIGPNGEVERVVSVGLDLSWMSRFAAESRLPAHYSLTALDSNGTVLVGYPEEGDGIGKPSPCRPLLEAISKRPSGGVLEAKDAGGSSRIYAYLPFSGAGGPGRLYVAVEVPTKRAYASIDRALYRNLSLLAIASAATLLLAMAGAQLLVLRPTRALVDAAERLTAGDLTARASSRTGGELGRLAAAFDTMALSLQTRMAERQQAVAEALESERRWRALLDNIRLLVVGLDVHGRVEYANPYLYELTGYAPEDVIGKEWPPSFAAQAAPDEAWPPPPDSGTGPAERHEGAVVTRAGEVRSVKWFNTYVEGPDGRISGTLSIGEDVTERRRWQEHARQQDRLAAVGELAAGIAHDFNNIVLSMTGYAELVMLDPDVSEVSRKRLTVIVDQGFRAAQLIRQILDFSRKSVSEKQPLQMGSLLREVCKLLERTLPEQVRLVVDARDGEKWIEGDPTQLQQILVNLAVNARDAMPDGGTLAVRLESRRLHESAPKPALGMSAGEWLVLTVSDTGTGIDPEDLGRIFEPFFTTKSPGAGTGLGLAQVYGLVTQHGGFVSVASRPGNGTDFLVWLPVTEPPAEAATVALPANAAPSPGAGELILLAEDERPVLDVLRIMLEQMGYRVAAAQSGREALELYERNADAVRLVVTDWVMPDGNGPELIRALRSRGCTAKILAMSGYPLGEEDPQHLEVDGFLQKPAKYTEVAEEVARVLGSAAVPGRSDQPPARPNAWSAAA